MEFLPKDTIAQIVSCVEDAFGDEIAADVQRNGLLTFNSPARRSWDFLNTKLLHTLNVGNCTTVKADRNWQMVVIFEKTTECILTFMKESRFSELRRNQRKRNHMHYVEILAKQFNSDVIPGYEQMAFYPHIFRDSTDEVQSKVQDILANFHTGLDVVQNHILVLFEANGYRLESIRAVKVTPQLDVAANYDDDWSGYISNAPSIVVDRVSNPDSRKNNPMGKLALGPKALLRQKTKLELKTGQEENTNLQSS